MAALYSHSQLRHLSMQLLYVTFKPVYFVDLYFHLIVQEAMLGVFFYNTITFRFRRYKNMTVAR